MDTRRARSRTRTRGAGESVDDVAARLTRVVDRVRSSGLERVLIFGHGHALRAMAMLWLGLPVDRGAHFPLYTGRVSVLGYEKTSPALVAWNVGELYEV
nr:histidine phosphatase family protein [Tessaracoccus coleopterorum]